MRPRSAAVIACRVIAIVFATQALTAIVSLISFLAEAGEVGASGPLWAQLVARILIAFVLWTQAEALADGIARGTVDEGPQMPRRTANAHTVAFSVVGLIFAVDAILAIIAIAATESGHGIPAFARDFTLFAPASSKAAAVITEVIKMGIGLWLLLESGTVARFLSRKYPEPEQPLSPPPGA